MTCSFTPFGEGSRVVSLWDMLRFHADLFVKVINGLHLVEDLLRQPESFLKNEGMVKFFGDQVKTLYYHLEEVKLPISAKKAFSLYILLSNNTTDAHDAMGQVVKRYSEELRDRIADELEGKTFLYISNHVGLLSSDAPFGEVVDSAFPSARYDISEAGCCLALRRSTACVLHLMRALEPGLSSLAAALGVSMPRKGWEMVLNKLQKEIEARSINPPDDKWKEENEPFFSEAASHFRIIKNAWRNHAAHGRDKYTEQEAEDIYRSVRSFMHHLSERLSEEGLSS